jgi:DNA-binding NarL/FixJ family response regulator
MGVSWRVAKVGVVKTIEGSTAVGLILEADDACIVPEEGDWLGPVVDGEVIGTVPETEPEPCPLAPRQLECLQGLADGLVYKQIAERMDVSISTVRTHLHAVYQRLEVPDRAQAVLLAKSKGWL